jgi:PTS system beta-glucosides-specific IIC component
VLLGFQEEADDAEQISGSIAAKPADVTPAAPAPVEVEVEPASATADSTAYAPMTGKAIPLKEVNDPTFGDELMGKGIAFVPTVGELVSPVSGTVMNVFKTKHAMVIRNTDGMELLIHVGINTVKLRGQFFEAHVQAGDPIQAGDKLLTFDLAQIAQNYDITTAMVVTNTADYKQILPLKLGEVAFGEPVLKAEL